MANRAEALLNSLPKSTSMPPVEQWDPPFSGDIDIRIDREGRWFHEGEPIVRQKLVVLFASILKREQDDYFLVTPVEKWRIQVDEKPFLFSEMRKESTSDGQGILLTTSLGDQIALCEEYPLVMEQTATGEPRPLVRVRRNLWGLLSRAVYYELVEWAEEEPATQVQGAESDKVEWVVYSCGERFVLG